MFDRICADNGIRHLLTAPYSPTTTGKVERLHKTMRAEFFTPQDRLFATVAELQDALDGWVIEYNTARPHQSCGGRPPVERFRLADRSIAADDPPRRRVRRQRPAPAAGPAPGGGVAVGERARQDLPGRVLLPRSAPTYAGEPVEVVVAGGLVDILHAGVVVATHAQRMRDDQADRAPRAPVARRARDATAGLTVTRLANGAGVVSFAGTAYPAGRRWARQPSTSRSWPGRCSCPRTARSSGSTRSATTAPASSARSPTPKAAPAARTPPPALSPSYRNSDCRPGTGT